MLNLFGGIGQNCEGFTRRHFLQIGSVGAFGLSLPGFLRAQALAARQGNATQDVNCILIWTRGGTSHHDSLDPKPDAPQEVRGEFDAIATAVPGVSFTEHVPHLAAAFKDFAVLRGLNPRNGSHGTADAYMMSGSRFNPSITHPCYGSVIAHDKGFKADIPPFIQVGTQVDQRFGGGSSGFLGIAHNPFVLPGNPSKDNFTVRDITPPGGMKLSRIERRQRVLDVVDGLARERDVQPDAFSALDEHYQTAFNMITSPATRKAFELPREDPRVRDRYGRSNLGQSCLLARRLIESGVRFVTVTNGGWDTHTNNFRSLKTRLLPPIDQALPALIGDLKQRGLLEKTLVVWMTDFGRTPKVNSSAGRDHWSTAGFVVMAGAGVPGGTVVGETDAEGAKVAKDEYFTEDVAATLYTKLGIPLDTIHTTPDDRPVKVCTGQPIPGLMG